MEVTKQFLEKVFLTKRMERYFALYPDDEAKAISHYECNLMLAESPYVSLSVLEVTLRNALCRELETMTGREDWYAIFPTTPGLRSLNFRCKGTAKIPMHCKTNSDGNVTFRDYPFSLYSNGVIAMCFLNRRTK